MFLTTLSASATRPSIQIAAFTAQTKAIMVTMAAAGRDLQIVEPY